MLHSYRKFFLPALTLLIISCMIWAAGVQKNSYAAMSHMSASTTEAQQKPLYIAGPYHGYVAIFLPDSTKPYETTNISLDSLLKSDQKKITSGIYLYSEKELTSFLEDYGS